MNARRAASEGEQPAGAQACAPPVICAHTVPAQQAPGLALQASPALTHCTPAGHRESDNTASNLTVRSVPIDRDSPARSVMSCGCCHHSERTSCTMLPCSRKERRCSGRRGAVLRRIRRAAKY